MSEPVKFKIYANFVKNPALSISTYSLAKNLIFPKIKVSFVCIPIILWVCTGMWYHKNSKSSKNKCNSSSVYSSYLAKGVREGKRFIPVAVTLLKPLRLPASF